MCVMLTFQPPSPLTTPFTAKEPEELWVNESTMSTLVQKRVAQSNVNSDETRFPQCHRNPFMSSS